ncbi:MAG: prolipoprotein diacylglyceryl transferase family protein [Bacteroidota bacterium]
MYPDLSYILHALIGTQPDNAFSIVKTFGLLLVLAILTAAFILDREVRRKEKEGLFKPVKIKIITGQPATLMDMLLNALLGFALGFKFFYIISNFSDFQIDPADIILSGKGNWPAGLILAAIFAGLKWWEKDKQKLDKPQEKLVAVYPHDRIGDITVLAAISGVIGAKLFAIGEDLDLLLSGQVSFSEFIGQLLSGSGLAIYGGLIVAFFVVFFYLRRKGIPPIHFMDAVAPALIVSYGVGRMGCHLSGDGDWGIASDLADRPSWLSWSPDWLWSFNYPHNVLERGQAIADCTWRYCKELENGVYPTSVYEFVMTLIIGLILWSLRKRIKIPGMLFFIYLIFNGMERFWIEKIRINDRYDVMGFQTTQAEFIAVILMIAGVIGCVFLWQRSRKAT